MKQEDLRSARLIEAKRRWIEDETPRREVEHLADLYETCWTPPVSDDLLAAREWHGAKWPGEKESAAAGKQDGLFTMEAYLAGCTRGREGALAEFVWPIAPSPSTCIHDAGWNAAIDACKAALALITAARRPNHIVGVNDMVGRPAEWQPIGPEQREGTPILAGSINHECREVVEWQDDGEDGNEGWVNTGAVKNRFYANPRWFTHYMHLPAAPKEPKCI